MRDRLLGFLKQIGSLARGYKEFILQKLLVEFSETSEFRSPKIKISYLFRYISKPLFKWCKQLDVFYKGCWSNIVSVSFSNYLFQQIDIHYHLELYNLSVTLKEYHLLYKEEYSFHSNSNHVYTAYKNHQC